jgi:very-short-patch-repair endonuclease
VVKKYWFKCNDCIIEYEQRPNGKTNKEAGCPRCVNKTEKKVGDYFNEYDIKFITQYQFSELKRYYDFCLPEFNLIIEIDGDQHFKQVGNWKSHEITLQNDIQKMKVAKEHGYSVLRIYQPDIWNEKVDWRQAILDNMYLRTIPDVTCISSIPEIYNNHV